jgi:sensor histidine kinase YesM
MRTKRLSIIFQVCFWLLIGVLQLTMASNFMPFSVALVFAGMNSILAMIVFYLNSKWIFPAFFERRRFLLYVLINLGLLILLSHVFLKLDGLFVRNFKIADLPPRLPVFFGYFRIFSLLMFILFISMVFSLISKVQAQELTERKLSREKMNTEIRLLKAQINPHFIFNSLNNIYSLAYSKSDQAPDAVLKLSQMLRYVYYDCNKDEVSLGAELAYIRNYIAFQQMKSPHQQRIDLQTDGVDENYRIAPMLFIPFVENSFKYSKIEDQEEAFVDIRLTTEGDTLLFYIANNHPDNGRDPGSGMGIENVRNRLELTYPDGYELDVRDENNRFEVNLKITRS